MFANGLARTVTRSSLATGSRVFRRVAKKSKISYVNRSLSSLTALENKDFLQVSPLSEVDIPNTDFHDYLRNKTKKYEDRIAFVST